MNLPNLSKEDAQVLATSLTSDLVYYNNGLNKLKKFKNSNTTEEFNKLLDEYSLPVHWTMDDVMLRYSNTSNLIRIIDLVVSDIQDSLNNDSI